METMYDRIKKLRQNCGWSQEELAKKVGYADKTSIAKIEAGKVDIPQSKIMAFAAAFHITPSYLMDGSTKDWNGSLSEKRGITINILNRIAADIPIGATEEIINTEEIPEEMAATGTFFGLKVKGDGMIPNICDGDVVIVRLQDDAENGEIVVTSVNGAEATCKRLRKYRDGIELIANNPTYAPLEFSNQEIAEKPVRILGKVVELRRKF